MVNKHFDILCFFYIYFLQKKSWVSPLFLKNPLHFSFTLKCVIERARYESIIHISISGNCCHFIPLEDFDKASSMRTTLCGQNRCFPHQGKIPGHLNNHQYW